MCWNKWTIDHEKFFCIQLFTSCTLCLIDLVLTKSTFICDNYNFVYIKLDTARVMLFCVYSYISFIEFAASVHLPITKGIPNKTPKMPKIYISAHMKNFPHKQKLYTHIPENVFNRAQFLVHLPKTLMCWHKFFQTIYHFNQNFLHINKSLTVNTK